MEYCSLFIETNAYYWFRMIWNIWKKCISRMVVKESHATPRIVYFSWFHEEAWNKVVWVSSGGSVAKESACSAEDTRDKVSSPGSGRSPGEGHGNDFSILTQRILWIEEPGRLRSIRLQSQTQLPLLSTAQYYHIVTCFLHAKEILDSRDPWMTFYSTITTFLPIQ